MGSYLGKVKVGEKEGLLRGNEETSAVTNMFTTLAVVTVSQVCTCRNSPDCTL